MIYAVEVRRWMLAVFLASASPVQALAQADTTLVTVPEQRQSLENAPPPLPALTLNDLEADTRLSRVFNLDVRGVEVVRVLDAVGAQMGVALSVAPECKDRRYTGLMRRGTVRSFMTNLSRTCRMSWRKLPNPPDASPPEVSAPRYELFQTEEQRRKEASLKAASERRETAYREGLRKRLRQAIDRALAGKDPEAGGLQTLLESYSSEQTDRAIDSALEPPDIISASDQSHFHSHFFTSTPFSQLSPAQQQAVRSIAARDRYQPSPTDSGEGETPPATAPDFGGMQVGLIAAAGGFRLGIVEPDGKDVWVSPRTRIGSVPSLDSQAQENDFDPAVEKTLRSETILNLRSMPPSLRRKKVRFPPALDRSSLSEFLGSLALQTGITVSCDDFLNSRVTGYSGILADKGEYTVEEALLQLARTFGHRMAYSGQCLFADTLTPGLDLRLEPPGKVMSRLGELQSGKVRPGLDDTLMFGGCTRMQVHCILRNHPIRHRMAGLLVRALRNYAGLRAYALLTPALQAAAKSEEGVEYQRLTREQQAAFDAVADIGLPALAPSDTGLRSRRFYVRPEFVPLPSGEQKPAVVLLITGRGEPPPIRRYDIR